MKPKPIFHALWLFLAIASPSLLADIIIDRPEGQTITARFTEPFTVSMDAATTLEDRLTLQIENAYSGAGPFAIGNTDASGLTVTLNGNAVPVTGTISGAGGISGAPVLRWGLTLDGGASYPVQAGDTLTFSGSLRFTNYLSASEFPDNLGQRTVTLLEGIPSSAVGSALTEIEAGMAQASPEVIQVNFGNNDAGAGWNNVTHADFNGTAALALMDRDGNASAVTLATGGSINPAIDPALVGLGNPATWNGGVTKDWVTPTAAQGAIMFGTTSGPVVLLQFKGLDAAASYRVEVLSALEDETANYTQGYATFQQWATQFRRPDTNYERVIENGSLVGTIPSRDFKAYTHGWEAATWVVWESESPGLSGFPSLPPFSNGPDTLMVYLESDAAVLNAIRLIKITPAPANNSPTALTLSTTALIENTEVGTTVATMTGSDQDVGDTLSFSLAAGAGDTDNADFTVSGGSLIASGGIDFESKSSYTIRLQVTDAAGAAYEESFVLTVSDDRTEDFDRDGLSEMDEEDVHGTSDLLADSDGDSFDDDVELNLGTDPTDSASKPTRSITFQNTAGVELGNPAVVDFGEVAVGSSKTVSLTVENTGMVTVGSLAFGFPGALARINHRRISDWANSRCGPVVFSVESHDRSFSGKWMLSKR